MFLDNRAPGVSTRHLGEPLTDERVVQALTDAFTPHRCMIEFQDDRRKVALRVRGQTGAEFIVDGKRLDLLRDPSALAQYIQDVRAHLSQHRLRFNAHAVSVSTSAGSTTPVANELLIDIGSWRDVRAIGHGNSAATISAP